MEELKTIKNPTQMLKIASCMHKIYKKIAEIKKKNADESHIKELAFLRTQCKSESVQLCLMSCQTYVKLVEDGILDINRAITDFMSLLPNSNTNQYSALTEGIVSLLLISLKRQFADAGKGDEFRNTYNLKSPQHPLIALIQTDDPNMIDIASKISGICNHHDKEISNNSIEFLRPVFLYIFCSPNCLPDSKTLWTDILSQSTRDPAAEVLFDEILSWSKISSSNSCLFTSNMVIEAIEHCKNQEKSALTAKLRVYLALIVNQLISFGVDPRPSLKCIFRSLHSSKDVGADSSFNVLLILLSQTLHIISPFYLPDALKVLSYIVVTKDTGNQYILNMVLDGTIQWMSQSTFIPAHGVNLAHQIIQKIIAGKANSKISTADFSSEVRYFHPDIALAFDTAKLAESFDESEFKNIFTFIDTINIKSKLPFCRRMNLFLRAIFLSKDPGLDCWFKIYQTILSVVKSSEDVAVNLLMTYIFKLASETNPEVQLELLKGLPSFAVSKDNVPMILNTFKTLTTGPNVTLATDLYLRLWKLDSRTYPFLLKLLTENKNDGNNPWEANINQAYTIREICLEKPQHGPDLVKHLSDILNICANEEGSLATTLALDAIVALCESNTVNIISTWNALKGKFRHEKRPEVVKSLYKLFGQVPLLPSLTPEYGRLIDECLDQLWLVVAESNDVELIKDALKTLENYKPGINMELKHIPPKFKENIPRILGGGRTATSEIPGECWVALLQRIKPECVREAADLISCYIAEEISTFGRGIYYVADGKSEPRKFTGLMPLSPLRAMVNYLVTQSHFGDHVSEPVAITAALRSISKKFSKPIPPVDWSCLHSFFHLNFETRKYCVLIAKNQVLYSGTAKRLLENFLVDFEPNIFEDSLLLLFGIMPEISNGVSTHVLKVFAEKIANYCFKESQLNGFVEGCLFEKFVDSVKSVFLGKVESPEVLDIFTTITMRYLDSIELDSRLFERYTELVAALHPRSIDELTSPKNWSEAPVIKLKKATIIRCYLVLYNNQIDNPLTWINPLIDAYIERTEEQTFFLRHLAITLFAYSDDKTSCAWLMDLSFQIQNLLSDVPKDEKQKKIKFLLDIYILSVVVLSGCAVLLGNLNVAATSPAARNEIFPESLQTLCDHIFWKDNESKIYEFLFHLYKNETFSEEYLKIFRNAIICSRNKSYFDNKSIWTKYLGIRN